MQISVINKQTLRRLLPGFIYEPLKAGYLYSLFVKDFLKYRKICKNQNRFPLSWGMRLPQIYDKTSTTGFDKHYVYHTAWAARAVQQISPEYHVDIGSSIYFSVLVSAFVAVRFYDYRPADLHLSGLTSHHGDLNKLPFEDGSIKSLSCMHTIEHVGLGRYGDPLDPEGDLKAIRELQRVLAPGGSLLFVVPVGKPKLAFNAHRIYAYRQIKEYFQDLELKQFTLISEKDNSTGLIVNASEQQADMEDYGCGCFWFVKRQ